MLREHGVRPEQLREVTMSVCFDLSRLHSPALTRVMLPLVCEVELTDDRGIVHVGTVRHEWSVETGEAPRGLP